MRRFASALAFLLVVSCGSGGVSGGGRPAEVAQPAIRVGLADMPFFGSSSTAPVTIDVEVLNRANVPVIVREVEVSSPGMVQWTIRTRRQRYAETIPPGQSRVISYFTEAITSTARPNEPLTTRTFVFFEANGHQWREIVFTRG